MRVTTEKDIDTVLIEEYNNGYIDINRLQKLSKLIKDVTYELRRENKFKMEAIDKSLRLKKLVDSVRLHKEQGKARAIYDEKEEPIRSENRVCSRYANRVEYFWKVHMSPILLFILGLIFCSLTLIVIFFEVSLYMSWDNGNIYESWASYSQANKGSSFLLANLICIIPLTYICAASYFGLFQIKVSSLYALHPKQ